MEKENIKQVRWLGVLGVEREGKFNLNRLWGKPHWEGETWGHM